MAAVAATFSDFVRDDLLTVATLRDWMQGRWALVFSHADDFASDGFEMDRWLVHVGQAFATAGLSPVAIARDGSAGSSWIPRVGGADMIIRWSDAHRAGGSMCTRERSLLSTILGQANRFVLTVDESLRPRLTYAYSPGDRLPSPIDLVWMAHRTRERLVG